jgi:replicative DNA helicase
MSAKLLPMAPSADLDTERDGNISTAVTLLTTDRSRDPGLGWLDLDRAVGPLLPGQLWIVLARPSMGKTTFALNTMARPAHRQRGFVYFATEETSAAAQLRYAAILAGQHAGAAVAGDLALDAKRRVADQLGGLRQAPVYFRDLPRPNVTDVQRAALAAREKGIGLIVVDHAHRMALPNAESQRASIEQSVRALKTVAVDTGITLLLTAQTRRPQGRLDACACPTMSEALGSSVFEQEADVMLGLYKPLRRVVQRGEREDLNSGAAPLGDVLMPHTMGVEVLKFRRNGDRVGARVLLHCADGLLSDRRGGA